MKTYASSIYCHPNTLRQVNRITGRRYNHLSFINSIQTTWDTRDAGQGESGRDRKVVITWHLSGIKSNLYRINEGTTIKSNVTRRNPNEAPFVENKVDVPKWWQFWRKNKLVQIHICCLNIVLYSREALLENGGKVDHNFDWEVVAVYSSPEPKTPMDPLTMARNMLELPGGTKSKYSAEEFARAIVYWSERVRS